MERQQAVKEVISFLGPPGSGKGTIAQAWQEESSVLVLSTGALCRQHMREHTEYGELFRQLVDSGSLVPDSLISAMVRSWLSDHQNHEGYVLLDGYPRTAEQASQWCGIMKEEMPEWQYRVIVFDISTETVVARLSQRLVCTSPGCEQVYSMSQGYDTCPRCQSPLKRRVDDNREVIEQRLAVYEKNKRALLERYAQLGMRVDHFDVEHVLFDEMYDQFLTVLNLSDVQGVSL
jgi:adenylate kinase